MFILISINSTFPIKTPHYPIFYSHWKLHQDERCYQFRFCLCSRPLHPRDGDQRSGCKLIEKTVNKKTLSLSNQCFNNVCIFVLIFCICVKKQISYTFFLQCNDVRTVTHLTDFHVNLCSTPEQFKTLCCQYNEKGCTIKYRCCVSALKCGDGFKPFPNRPS